MKAESSVVHAMLEFIYCGKTTKTAQFKNWEAAISLFQTAQMYELSELATSCVGIVEKFLTSENAMATLKIASTHICSPPNPPPQTSISGAVAVQSSSRKRKAPAEDAEDVEDADLKAAIAASIAPPPQSAAATQLVNVTRAYIQRNIDSFLTALPGVVAVVLPSSLAAKPSASSSSGPKDATDNAAAAAAAAAAASAGAGTASAPLSLSDCDEDDAPASAPAGPAGAGGPADSGADVGPPHPKRGRWAARSSH
jgi:hypothetical protein